MLLRGLCPPALALGRACARTVRLDRCAVRRSAGPKETPEERRLRHAACLISDIGWRAHPDYRGEQSLNVIAHAALAGIDHPGRAVPGADRLSSAMPAPATRAPSELSVRLRKAIDKRSLKRARIVGAAIRAAHMISIGMAGIIDETPLFYDGGKLVLTLPAAYRSDERRAAGAPLRGAGRSCSNGRPKFAI